MRAFVTGATGFLGQRVIGALVRAGWRVRASSRTPDTLARLAHEHGRIEPVCLRLDRDSLDPRLFDGCDVLFHLAGALQGATSALCLHNVFATRRLLDAVRATDVHRVIVVSSLAVYSCSALHAWDELDESCPLEQHPETRGGYVFSKIAQERVCRDAEAAGLPVVVMRPGVIYGPGRNPISDRVGLRVVDRLVVVGGRHPLPYTYVDNCAGAIVAAGLAPRIDGLAFNIVDDELPTGDAIARRFGVDAGLRIWRVPRRAIAPLAAVYDFCRTHSRGQLPAVLTPRVVRSLYQPMRYSNRRAKEALDWRPLIGLQEGLERTLGSRLPRWPDPIRPPASRVRQFDPEICQFTERS